MAAAAAAEPAVAAEAAAEPQEAYASLRFARGSAHKYRKVIDTIRGRTYEEALMILEFMPHRACDNIMKVLYSAAANASHNYGMPKSDLYVARAMVGEGPKLKRFTPRAKGRPGKILKPYCHVEVWLAAGEGPLGSGPSRANRTPTNARRRARAERTAAALVEDLGPAEEEAGGDAAEAEAEVEEEAPAEE